MRTLICLLCQLHRYYPRLSLIDLMIAACEELLAQNERIPMSKRLSDDEKRYFTDQISMLKNENERLTKYVEELDSAHAQVDKWIEKAGDLQTELTLIESQIEAMRDFVALLYLGIREGRDKAFEALDEKTKKLINEVWFERLEEE